MSRDNVTPFRPRLKPVKPQQSGGMGLKTHRGKAVLAHLLTLAAFALNWFYQAPPLSLLGAGVGIAAAALAYSNRGEGMPWAATHHQHALRTLIIGYSIWIFGSLLMYISRFLQPATLLVYLAVALWAGLRAVIALVLAVQRKPVPNPRGWLV